MYFYLLLRKVLLCSFAVLINTAPIYSANNADSLQQALIILQQQGREDTVITTVLKEVSKKLRHSNPQLAAEYLHEALRISKKINHAKEIAESYNILGNFYRSQQMPALALKHYFLNLDIQEETENETSIAYAFLDIGNIYFDNKLYDLANQHYTRAYNLSIKSGNKNAIGTSLNNLALVKRYLKQFDSALILHKQALNVREQLNDTALIAHSYRYLGRIYLEMEQPETSLTYFNKAQDIYRYLDIKQEVAGITDDIGYVHLKKGDIENGLKFRLDAIDQYNTIEIPVACAEIQLQLVNFFVEKNQPFKALQFAEEAMVNAKKTQLIKLKQRILTQLGNLYLKTGNPQKSAEIYFILNQLTDSLAKQSHENEILLLKQEYLASKSEKDLNKLEHQNRLNYLQLQESKESNNLLLLAAFVFFLLLLLIFYAYTIKRISNKKLKEKNTLIHRQKIEIENTIDALQKAKAQAEDFAATKGNFLNLMSHEIRTPLSAIIGLTSLMHQEQLPEDQKQNMHALKISADNLLLLLNDVLDLGKLESNKILLEDKPFNLPALLQHLHKAYLPAALSKNLEFNIELHEKLPVFVAGDPTRITQVLTNLIGNALKFTHKGSINLKSKLIETTNSHSKIEFKVEDTGIGIKNIHIDKIFDEFAQENIETARKYGGTGLGLSISRQILELMQSKIVVKSEEGNGTCFSFTLKLKNTQNPSPMENNNLLSTEELKILQKASILVAEDDPINQFVLKKILAKWDVEATMVSNGQEVLDNLMQQNFDIILMDMEMPGMNGYDATLAIRNLAEFENLPILAMTAHTLPEATEKILQSGITDMISKPFDPQELAVKLVHYIKMGVEA